MVICRALRVGLGRQLTLGVEGIVGIAKLRNLIQGVGGRSSRSDPFSANAPGTDEITIASS